MHWKLSFTRGVSTLGSRSSLRLRLSVESRVYFILWLVHVYGAWGIKHIHADTCYMHHTPPSCSTRVPPPQYADGAPAQGILAISFGPRVGYQQNPEICYLQSAPSAALMHQARLLHTHAPYVLRIVFCKEKKIVSKNILRYAKDPLLHAAATWLRKSTLLPRL